MEIKYQEGTNVGNLLKKFKDKIDQPLVAILTLNTIAHTAGAIGVGAQATKIWAGNTLVTGTVVPVLMTLAILILSELIPKTLGANHYKSLTGFTVKSLNIVITILYPLVWLGQMITKSMKKDKGKSVLSRTDFQVMTSIGTKQGVFKESESKIIQNLLRFETIRAKDIMTPRTVVKAVSDETTIQEFFNANKNLRFSRIPIYKGTRDHISGFFLKDELLINIINNNGNAPISDIAREILITSDTAPIPELFNKLMEKREHIALVVGEFGGMAGIVTMEDVIETLLGLEIMDELDGTEDMQVLARKNWEKRAKSLGILEKDGE
ncbi:MAG: CBS domain containing-hemolysin-like protein [Saprospiraceae bacterium]